MERNLLTIRAGLCVAFGAVLALGFGLTPGQALAQSDESLVDQAQEDAGEAWDATKEAVEEASE